MDNPFLDDGMWAIVDEQWFFFAVVVDSFATGGMLLRWHCSGVASNVGMAMMNALLLLFLRWRCSDVAGNVGAVGAVGGVINDIVVDGRVIGDGTGDTLWCIDVGVCWC